MMRQGWLLIILGMIVLGALACDPVQLPHQKPGPVGCGIKDPRKTAPGKLSMGQKKALRDQGPPGQVKPNDHGGLDWLYVRRSGSVFGEEEQVERFSFDAQGVLVARNAELIYKKGK